MSKLTILGEGYANHGNFTVKAAFLPLHNSYLLLVSDQEDYGIGTVTLSAPPSGLGSASSSPFNMFGLKNSMLANLIGKNASKQLKKPVLSLILIKENSLKQSLITKLTMEAVLKAIEKIKKNKNNKTKKKKK